MKKPSLPVLKKAYRQVRQHGVSLLVEQLLRRKEILSSAPVRCHPNARLEVHMQVCHRDWLNAIWTLKSLRAQCTDGFSLFLYLDVNVPPPVRMIFETHFPEIQVPQPDWLEEQVRLRLAPIAPLIATLWRTQHSPTLNKMVNAWICAQKERLLYLDPDVLFFAPPGELLADVQPVGSGNSLGLFNATRLPPASLTDSGAFCVSEAEVQQNYHLTLPRDFNAGIGIIHRKAIDWPFIDEVLSKLRWIPDRKLLWDQTCLGLLAARSGWNRLDQKYYLVDDGAINSKTVAAHYFGRDRRAAFYAEGIPLVRRLGLFAKLKAFRP